MSALNNKQTTNEGNKKMNNITQFLNKNKRIIPLNGKIPVTDDWVNSNYTLKQLAKHKGNFGWALDSCDLVIDVDPRNGGKQSYDKLYQKLKDFDDNLDFRPSVITPSGGFHIYLSLPTSFKGKIKKNLKEYPGIDFLSFGAQCVIPESKTEKGKYTWYDDIFCEFIQMSAPKALLDIIARQDIKPKLVVTGTSSFDYLDDDDELNELLGLPTKAQRKEAEIDIDDLTGSSGSDLAVEEVEEYLSVLDPSSEYDTWIKIGMALHDWDKVKGLSLWEKWSKDGDNYQKGATRKHWKSFTVGNGVSVGTLKFMVQEVEREKYKIIIDDLVKEIKSADKDQLEKIISKIPKQDFEDVDREVLAHEVQARYKSLLDIKIPIADLRKRLSPIRYNRDEDVDTPTWCKNWVYVNSHTAFINIKTMKAHKSESFNLENGKHVPENDSGNKLSATKYVSDNGYIMKVDNLAYLPTYSHYIVELDNQKILNTFNPSTVPLTDAEYTTDGKDAIETVKRHIKLICSSDENSDIFTQWLAHQVQYPGKQILWSPVIQAIQGVGKSFFGELLRQCMGDRNVGVVSPTQVVSQFNGWATGTAVNVLEELRVVGHNRFEAINALKPLITDRMIQINDKGVKQYTTYNTSNYICFTNYKDALPIDEDDRRWWIIFVEIKSLSEIDELTGVPHNIYFAKLFDAIRKNPGQIRKWLLEYKISDEFIKIKQAPMTNYKRSMILTEEAGIEGLEQIRELIDKGSEYYNSEVVESAELFGDFEEEYPEIILSNHKKNQLLKRLGYTIHPQKIHLKNKYRRIWTKNPLTKDKILEILNLDF